MAVGRLKMLTKPLEEQRGDGLLKVISVLQQMTIINRNRLTR